MATHNGSSSVQRPTRVVNKDKAKNAAAINNIQRSTPYEFSFSLLSMKDVAQLPRITSSATTTDDGALHDLRLGAFDDQPCMTCGNTYGMCRGHPGWIDFGTRIPNPKFMKVIENLLKITCANCGQIHIDFGGSGVMGKKSGDSYAQENDPMYRLQTVAALASNQTYKTADCPHCQQPTIYKYSSGDESKGGSEVAGTFYRAPVFPAGRAKAFVSYSEVAQHLEAIPVEVQQALGLVFPPIQHMMQGIIVTPNVHRLRTEGPNKTFNSTFTGIYAKIIDATNQVAAAAGEPPKDNRDPALAIWKAVYDIQLKDAEGQQPASVKAQLNSKKGLFRHHLLSKTTEYSGRAVIGPDPSLPFGYVGIPRIFAPILTKPRMVNRINARQCRRFVLNNQVRTIRFRDGGYVDLHNKVRNLTRLDRVKQLRYYANKLRIGDTINRHLQDGDVVLINRAPTIHKMSIQAFTVKLTDNPGITLHMASTGAFNADFDGDEMQVYDLQMMQAELEARYIMYTANCMFTGFDSTPVVGIIYDALSAAYLVTDENEFLSMHRMMDLLARIATPLQTAHGTTIAATIPSEYALVEMLSRYKDEGINPIRYGRAEFPRTLFAEYLASKAFKYAVSGRTGRVAADFMSGLLDYVIANEVDETNYIERLTSLQDKYVENALQLVFGDKNQITAADMGVMLDVELTQTGTLSRDAARKSLSRVIARPLRYLEVMGRVLLSMILPENFDYTNAGATIRNSVILNQLNKKQVGASQNSLIHVTFKLYGMDEAVRLVTQFYWALDGYLSGRGLSVSLASCYPEKFYRPGIASGFLLLQLMKYISTLSSEEQVTMDDLLGASDEVITTVINGAMQAAETRYVSLPASKRPVYERILRDALYFVRREIQTRLQLRSALTYLSDTVKPEEVMSRLANEYDTDLILTNDDIVRLIDSLQVPIDQLAQTEPTDATNLAIEVSNDPRLLINILTDMIDYRRDIDEIIDAAQRDIQEYSNRLEQTPMGERERESLREEKVLNATNAAKIKIENRIVGKISQSNPMSIMIKSGAKGNTTNLVQMSGAMGQQYVKSERMAVNEFGRSLPFYSGETPVGNILARGFISSNLTEGLDPGEMLAHAAGAREGVIDSALKTADVGAAGRDVREAMEDVVVAQNGAVVNNRNDIIQFTYHDGFNTTSIMRKGGDTLPVDFQGVANKLARKARLARRARQ